jgi:hypothetical protein
MNATIGKSAGLAMLMAFGIIATMVALGVFTSSNAAASHPVGQAIAIPDGGIINVPNTPGVLATYTISFQPLRDLSQGDSIYIKFDKNISVPASMEKERVTITAFSGGSSNPLSDPEISKDANNNTIIKLALGDTQPLTPLIVDNLAGLAGTDVHLLTFSTLAGIRNATNPDVNDTWANMSDDGVNFGAEAEDIIHVLRWLDLNDNSDARGFELTLTGKGWKDGTATVFLKLSTGDGFIPGTDIIIGTSDAAISGGEFTATFVVDTNFEVGDNLINATDGRGETAFLSATDPDFGARYESQDFELRGKLTVSTTTATRGEEITLTAEDYGGTAGVGLVTGITFGGIAVANADLPGSLGISNHTGTFIVTVPSTAQIGAQTITLITNANPDTRRTVGISIVGLSVIASPSTVVADQDVTISGSGFGNNEKLATISVAGTGNLVTILTDNSKVTDKSTDSSGNLVATFAIPIDETTRTPGTHKIIITDASGRVGEAIITIPERTLILDSVESRRGSIVGFSGTGYQADSTISIFYGPTSGTPRTTTTADAAGNMSGTFTVQNTVGIPSTTTVNAQSGCSTRGTDSCTQRTADAVHKVPAAAVTVEPTSAAPGDTIMISGLGFPGFVPVADLTIANVSALPSPAPSTDADGIFTTTALVPQLDTGSQALLVTAGGTTATASFTVLMAGVVPVTTTNNTTDVFADEINSDNLVRVWLFSNADQTWSFFDPRPAFAAANTLTTSTSGDIVWVNVIAETTFQGQTLFPGWNLISLK